MFSKQIQEIRLLNPRWNVEFADFWIILPKIVRFTFRIFDWKKI